jgi:ribosomal protein S18 acetylase RimI-like enzyme
MALLIRRCHLRDVSRLRDLAKVCWHSTYDRILGRDQAALVGGRAYSTFNAAYWIAQSLLSRSSTVLMADHGDVPVGFAMAQRDGPEIILFSLYVHPDWQGKGIGSALLDAVIARHGGSDAIRLEVLKDNTAAIAWYQAKGFETYGDTDHATGASNTAALDLAKKLGRT